MTARQQLSNLGFGSGMRRRFSLYRKLNVTISIPRSASAVAKTTMKPLVWSAPAPCPRINVTPARLAVAAG
jgi:hypothetical protein